MKWRELWTAIRSQLPDRKLSLRRRSIKAKNRLQKKIKQRRQWKSSGSRKLNVASISGPLELHVERRQAGAHQQPYTLAPPPDLPRRVSGSSTDDDPEISSLRLPEPSSSKSSGVGHMVSKQPTTQRPCTRRGRHDLLLDQHLLLNEAYEPTFDEIDAYCLGFIQGPYLKTALGAGQLPVSHDPLASHPTQPSMELFYPALYRSVALSDSRNLKPLPACKSTTFVPRAPELQASFSSVGSRSAAAMSDCELFACRSRLDGRPRFLLEHTVHLYGPRDRRPVKNLVSQMDITDSLRKLAVHLLRNVSDEALSMSLSQSIGSLEQEQELDQTSGEPIQRRWRDSGIDMEPAPRTSVSESTSSSCSTYDMSSNTSPPPPRATPPPRSASHSPPFAPPALAHALHEFHEFIADICYLYRDAFVLTPGPSNQYWQIAQTTGSLQSACWPLRTLSARKFASGDTYPCSLQSSSLSASLAHTDPALLYQLGQHMAAQRPVQTVVRWGSAAPGREMRMYCVPLQPGTANNDYQDGKNHGGFVSKKAESQKQQQCWVCWLTDVRVPDLWALESARSAPCW